jgi:hypothetical protein
MELRTYVSVLLNTTTYRQRNTYFFCKDRFYSSGSHARTVSIGDLNGDGKPDLAVTNNSDNSVSVLLNTTTPGASTPTFSAKTDFTTGTVPYPVSIG